MHFGGEAVVKYAAFDKRFQALRPNNILVWSIIRWYCENGDKKLSFGRSDMNNDGLRRFKRGWNLEEGKLRYYRFDMKGNQLTDGHNPLLDMSAGFIKKMPVPA